VSDPLSFVNPGDPIGELARADRINLLIESARRVLRPQAPPDDTEKEIFRALQPHNIVYVKTPVPAREYTVWRIVENLTSMGAILVPQAYRVDMPEDSCDPFVVLVEPSDGVSLARAAISGVVFGYVYGDGDYAHANPGDPYFLEAGDYGPARILYRAGGYALLRLGDSRRPRRCKKLKTDEYGYAYYGPYGFEIEDEDKRDEDEERQCVDCLAKLCVVRDYSGAIVDIFYEDASGSRVRVAECTSVPHSAPTSTPGGGGGGGGGGGDSCCPADGTRYVVEYDFVVFGNSYSGTNTGSQITWGSGICTGGFEDFNPVCDPGPPEQHLSVSMYFTCDSNGFHVYFSAQCGSSTCNLTTDDFDVTVTGCPGNPTYYLTIKPGRCASGSFVVRPA
jgi:hypothetical protein